MRCRGGAEGSGGGEIVQIVGTGVEVGVPGEEGTGGCQGS